MESRNSFEEEAKKLFAAVDTNGNAHHEAEKKRKKERKVHDGSLSVGINKNEQQKINNGATSHTIKDLCRPVPDEIVNIHAVL